MNINSESIGPITPQSVGSTGSDLTIRRPQQLSTATAFPPASCDRSSTSHELSHHINEVAEKKSTFGGEILQSYVKNAIVNMKMIAGALVDLGKLALDKGKISPLTVAFGVVFAGVALLALTAIRACIFLPTLALIITAVLVGGAVGGAYCALSGNKEALLEGIKNIKSTVTAHLTSGALGMAGTVLSGLSIVAKGPLKVFAETGLHLLEKSIPKNAEQAKQQEERLTHFQLAMQQAYQDTLSLWTGRTDSIWSAIHVVSDSLGEDIKDKIMLKALEAGADPYSKAWCDGLKTLFTAKMSDAEIDKGIEMIKNRLINEAA